MKLVVAVDTNFDIFKTPVRFQMTARDVLMAESKDVDVLDQNDRDSYFEGLSYSPDRILKVNDYEDSYKWKIKF